MNATVFKKLVDVTAPNKLRVLQIGANDGVQDDPLNALIHEHKPNCIMVEPVPKYFNQLKTNYAAHADNIIFVNKAVCDHTGVVNMEMIDIPEDSSLPVWVKGCSTISPKRNVLSGYGNQGLKTKMDDTLMKNIQDQTTTVQVPCVTLPDLLKECKWDSVDVYVSDMEGLDISVFLQLDLIQFRPGIILMETHTHPQEEQDELTMHLKQHNYTILKHQWDTLAVANEWCC